MAKARIYQPAKTAMQSGRGKMQKWILEFEEASPKFIEPLMGWTGTYDTTQQIHLRFDSMEEAIRFAESKHIPYRVYQPKQRIVLPKSYAANFRYDRVKLNA